MQDCAYSLNALDEAEQNITQELASILRRIETHSGRSEQLSEIYNSIVNAQSELKMQPPIYVNLLIVKVLILNEWNSSIQLEIFIVWRANTVPNLKNSNKNMNTGNRN
jgi:hypothetical protein